MPMTGNEMKQARVDLGRRWFGRPLHQAELGRALRLAAADPGQSIRKYEDGKTPISGPIEVAVTMMLGGALPPDPLDRIKTHRN